MTEILHQLLVMYPIIYIGHMRHPNSKRWLAFRFLNHLRTVSQTANYEGTL